MANDTVQITDKASVLGTTRTAKVDANGNLQVTLGGTGANAAATPAYVNTTPGTPITGASGNVAAASAVATLTAVAAKTTWITGFEITGAGATAASVINVTVTGTITGTLTYTLAIPAGVTVGVTPLVITFPNPIPASAVNTNIVVTAPSFGTGNTNATAVAHGFNL